MARDKFHQDVRLALENEGWTITDDPLSFKIGGMQVHIDLGAEQLIGAEKGTEKIAVEIKTFGNLSFVTALYEAIGKYIVYRNVLKIREPERTLFLAVPDSAFNRFLEEILVERIVQDENFKMVIYDPFNQNIVKWIK